jgi:hypothetical protein
MARGMAQIVHQQLAWFRNFLDVLQNETAGFGGFYAKRNIRNGLGVGLAQSGRRQSRKAPRRLQLVAQRHAKGVNERGILGGRTMPGLEQRANVPWVWPAAQCIRCRALDKRIPVTQTGHSEFALRRSPVRCFGKNAHRVRADGSIIVARAG